MKERAKRLTYQPYLFVGLQKAHQCFKPSCAIMTFWSRSNAAWNVLGSRVVDNDAHDARTAGFVKVFADGLFLYAQTTFAKVTTARRDNFADVALTNGLDAIIRRFTPVTGRSPGPVRPASRVFRARKHGPALNARRSMTVHFFFSNPPRVPATPVLIIPPRHGLVFPSFDHHSGTLTAQPRQRGIAIEYTGVRTNSV